MEDLQEENRRLVRKSVFSAPANGPSTSFLGPSANGARAGPSYSNSASGATFSQQSSQPVPNGAPSGSKGTLVWKTVEEYDEDDAVFATRIELEWRNQVEDRDNASLSFALQQQQRYEEEDRQLREQYSELQKAVPKTFQCGICLEEETEFMVSHIDPCGHKFCR